MTRASDKRQQGLREKVIGTLGEGALPIAELRTRLGSPWDRATDRDELDRLLQLDTSFTQVDGGIAFLPALADRTAWTVFVDPTDAARGFVRTDPQLAPLAWWFIDEQVSILDADGQPVGTLESDGILLDRRDTDVVTGPDGWLDGLSGRWAAVEVQDGAVRWSALDQPPAATAEQALEGRVRPSSSR